MTSIIIMMTIIQNQCPNKKNDNDNDNNENNNNDNNNNNNKDNKL